MSDAVPECPIRLRAFPLAKRKRVPKPRRDWPVCALVLNSILDRDRSMRIGNLLELVSTWPVNEALVFAGAEPEPELLEYVASHRAETLPGSDRRIALVPRGLWRNTDRLDGLGYRLRDRGYRRGWTLVCAGARDQLLGVAEAWGHSEEPGAWSIALPGLGRWDLDERGRPKFKGFADSPRLIVMPIGDNELIRWGTTPKEPDQDSDPAVTDLPYRRPPPKSGAVVDVLTAGLALTGRDNLGGLKGTCAALGVAWVEAVSDEIGGLRRDTYAIAQLYGAEVALVRELDFGIDLSNLLSTGGIATALSREAGLR